jgi:hypothetical protein
MTGNVKGTTNFWMKMQKLLSNRVIRDYNDTIKDCLSSKPASTFFSSIIRMHLRKSSTLLEIPGAKFGNHLYWLPESFCLRKQKSAPILPGLRAAIDPARDRGSYPTSGQFAQVPNF